MSNTRTAPGMRAALAAAGIDPEEVGRKFGRPQAIGATATAVVDEIDMDKLPTTVEGLKGCLEDEGFVAKLTGHPDAFGQFVKNWMQTQYKEDMSVRAQVSELVEKGMQAFLKEQAEQGATPVSPVPFAEAGYRGQARTAAQKNKLYNPRAIGAKFDKEFENVGDFLKAIWHNTRPDIKTQASLDRIQAAFSSGVPSDGGFLIPEVLRSELLRVSLEQSIVRSRARVIPMDAPRVPFPCVDSTTNVGSVYGGLNAYWAEEAAALTGSSAKFGRVVLDAKKLTMYTEVPNELLTDSLPSFQAFIDDVFPEALGFFEDVGFLTGTGVGEPLGVLRAAATILANKEVGQAANTIQWENLINMFARMLPGSLGRAVWVASIDTFPQLATMAMQVGTGGVPVWLNSGVEGPPMSILGRPVIFTEKGSLLGTAGDLSFIDFGMYLIGDRQQMSARSSEEYKFGNDMTAYRIIERVDGIPWLQSAITPQNAGPTLSPYVQIETRA
jgi:HK97 family phage major capsid protein